jgi:hypothetical protein
VTFGGSGLIREVTFGGSGFIREVTFGGSCFIRGVTFGGSGLIRGGRLYIITMDAILDINLLKIMWFICFSVYFEEAMDHLGTMKPEEKK